MDFIVIVTITLALTIILKYIFDYNVKKINSLGSDNKLDEIAKKYPSNIEMCKEYLKKINNENVEVEENKDTQASLYIAITNKISIANIQKSYTRIQTIAHECLHSIQDRKMLIFNFIFSNIYLLYFIAICILAIFKILPYKMMFLALLIFLSLIYQTVRAFLENDAMIKARYLAKDYMEDKKISSKEEIEEMTQKFDKINNIGIKCVNYNLFLNSSVKILIFGLICIVR